jgi:hypothetical protein
MLAVKYSTELKLNYRQMLIPNFSHQDATFLELFIFTHALSVSDGSSAHYQEYTTLHTASDSFNQYCR